MRKILVLMCIPFYMSAQVNADGSSPSETTSVVGQPGADNPVAQGNETPLSRWLEVDALSFTMRYRNSFDTNGQPVFDNIQARNLVAGKIKLDKEGKYFVGFRAESGKYFNWSFGGFSGIDYKTSIIAAFPHGTPQRQGRVFASYYADPQAGAVLGNLSSRGWQFYMRDLYLSATPIKAVTVEFGAIPIERGEGSEITTYDEDGYISGERVRVHDPALLHLDEVEFTSAYLGDVFTPNFFDRYDRLSQSNYRQVLVDKHFGSRFKASMDYTWLVGTDTLREALTAKTTEIRLLDGVRVEFYQRLNDIQLPGILAKAGNGAAFTGTKQLAKRVTVEGGFASVDQYAGVYSGNPTLTAQGFAINGDSYGVGDRFFGKANVKIVPGISLFGFYTHQIDSKATPLTFSYTRQNYNVGMEVNFKNMLQRAGVI